MANVTEVIGYAYDAAIHCVDCARNAFSSDSANGIAPEDALDSEGNPVHAVLGGSETDCPMHCDDCGTFIPEDLTADGVAYVIESLGSYIHAAVFGGHGGNAAVLDTWRDEYGDYIRHTRRHGGSMPLESGDKNGENYGARILALYDKLRDRQQEARTIILTSYDRGMGRSYGSTADGATFTTFIHDDSESDCPNECAECGQLVYSGWICLDGGECYCAGHIVTPDDVRAIARDWHSGQASGLYALSSSGLVTIGAVIELRRELHTLDDASRPTTMTAEERYRVRQALRVALAYCEAKTGHAADRFIEELAKVTDYVSPPDSLTVNAERFTVHVLSMLREYGIG